MSIAQSHTWFSFCQLVLHILVPSNGSAYDLVRIGAHSSTSEGQVNEIFSQPAQLPFLTETMHQMDSHVTASNNSSGGFTAKLIEMEQNMSTLAVRITALDGGIGFASGISGSPAGSWPLPWHAGGSTATASRDPGSVDDDKNIRRQLGKKPDDENSRSAVLPRFPHARRRAGVSAWPVNKSSGSEKV